MLKITNLTKTFSSSKGKVTALDNLSFTINQGEIYALIGPNGAGKTTAIKIIVGLYRKNKGEVRYLGKEITEKDDKERSSIGYIPDEPLFYPFLSGFEVLDFLRILHQVPKKDYQERLKNLLTYFPIEEILDDPPETYSRGNKQKLSIIASLIHKPKLLVVDEPVVGLDPVSIEKTAQIFEEFVKSKGAILVSTHTLSFVEKVADKIGIIKNGKILIEGKVDEIIKKTKGLKDLSSSFISLVN